MTPLAKLALDKIKIDRAYLVSCTNSRASDLAAAAKVFKDAAKENNGKIPKVADGVNFYVAAASKPEQVAAEAAGDWQALVEAGAQPLPPGCGPCIGLGIGLLQPGEVGISASNRNFKGRMGSTDAKAYLASPEVVAASALSGKISGPDRYQKPEGWKGVEFGEGDGTQEADRMITTDEALDKIIGQLDSKVANAEKELSTETEIPTQQDEEKLVSILPGFPKKITGEIVFCDADSINTDGIYPGKLTYQDYVPTDQMAEACMQNYDSAFSSVAKEGDILVSGFSFGCGSSREQAATAILAKGIPLVVSGSFGNIFSRNSINNALMCLEVPKLIERLRQSFPVPSVHQKQDVTELSQNKESLDSPPAAPFKKTPRVLTRRTGWTLTWDVRRCKVEIDEGDGKPKWSVKVGELPANVQEIIARGGLEKWVKSQMEAAA